jgi:hypothetical protein
MSSGLRPRAISLGAVGWDIFFDFEGQPITLERWLLLLESPEVFVARTQIGEQDVRTDYIGLDGSYGYHQPPLIYETMIFPECEVYSRTPTRTAALASHDQAVASLRRPVPDDAR